VCVCGVLCEFGACCGVCVVIMCVCGVWCGVCVVHVCMVCLCVCVVCVSEFVSSV